MSTLQSRISSVLPWATWAFMLLAGLLFVAHYGSNVPSWDDWDMVPTLTHNQPVTWEWLWSQHNEHRVPVPRLAFLGLIHLTTLDFRVPMFFNFLAMAALAAALTVVVRRLRGTPSLSDVFFPLATLNIGQAANLLWGWQIQFFLSVIFACLALLAMLITGRVVRPVATGLMAGIVAILLVGCGANGVGLVPLLALWPLVLALLPSEQGGVNTRASARLLIAVSITALLVVGFYFVGWEQVPYHPKSERVLRTVKTAVQFLTIGLGPATRSSYPWSALVTMLLLGATVLRLGWVALRGPSERGRSLGLLLFIAAMSALALGLGLGRDGFETRYVTLAVPAWCCVYFAWDLYGAAASKWVRAGLALAALAALWGNINFGIDYAEKLRGGLAAFERDLKAGVPAHELVHHYNQWLHPHHDIPTRYLPMLKRAGVPAYRGLIEDEPFHVIPIDLHPAAFEQLHWHNAAAEVIGPKAWLRFELPLDRPVSGIRLGYTYRSQDGKLPYVAMRWKAKASADFSDHFYKFSPTGDHANWVRGTWDRINDSTTSLTVWISDTVGEIEIFPSFSYPATFHVTELSLLVPVE